MVLCILGLAVAATLAGAQFTKTCTGNFCINQVFDAPTRSTYGFIAKTSKTGKFSDDFIAKVDVPLPYGFAGFSVANTTAKIQNAPTMAIVAWMGHPADENNRRSADYGMIIQQAAASAKDPSALVPLPGATITISPLSFYNVTLISFVFRCQNCALAELPASTGVPFQMVFMNSDVQPQMATPGARSATVHTGGAVVSSTSVNSVEELAVSEKEYAKVLSAAKLGGGDSW